MNTTNRIFSVEFTECLICSADTTSDNNNYDIAIASELLAENAKKINSETEAAEYTTKALQAWRKEALGPTKGPSSIFLEMLEITVRSTSSTALDKAEAARVLAEHYEQVKDACKAADWWRESAKAYAAMAK